MKIWNIGVYIRLSQEDGDKEESNSVINQRELINNYLSEENDYTIYDYYIDDGWSGTNFDRPNFNRLIKDIQNKTINCIIVKDLSRFGRNYIEVGNYLETIFPINNIRFIAINDSIDSYKDPESINNIIVPFKNLMNDEYCRDISQKVKYALNIRKKNGEYMAGIPPYGYIKSPKDKHKLIIDEESANVVKKIFNLYLKGYGTTVIARKLNDLKIPTPSRYKSEVLKLNFKCRNNGNNYWNDSTVSSILRNRIYLGEMVQCKFKKVSYKVNKKVKNNKEDWIIVKGTHEPIVSYKDYDKVQTMIDSRNWCCNHDGTVSIFAGKIKCGDCKANMNRNKNGNKYGKVHYYCSTYMRRSRKLCTIHSIREDTIKDIVLTSLNQQIKLVLDNSKVIKNLIDNNKNTKLKKEYLNKIEELNTDIKKLDGFKREVYMDWKKNIITQNDYFSYVNNYSKNISDLNNQIREYELKIDSIKEYSIDDYIDLCKKYKNIKELDRDIVDEFIDAIYIYEDKKIEIIFKYQDIYKSLLERDESYE